MIFEAWLIEMYLSILIWFLMEFIHEICILRIIKQLAESLFIHSFDQYFRVGNHYTVLKNSYFLVRG